MKDDNRILLVFLSVLVFSAFAHLYCYTNMGLNSDSLGIFRGGIDIARQIGRGRWLQPVYHLFRGNVNAPYLNGLLATLFLSVSIVLMVKILEIRTRALIVILCGLFSVAPSITLTNAAYIPWSDIFMLSLLFSMISAYCLTESTGKLRYLVGAVFLFLSLALYQVYIDACMLICLLWLLRKSIMGESTCSITKNAAAMILTFAVSLGLYYVSFKLICSVMAITPSSGYNSVASATVLSAPRRIPGLTIKAYKNILAYIIHPETFHSTLAGWIHICMILIAGVFLYSAVKGKKPFRTAMILLLVLLCPLASYFIYLLFGRNDSLLTFPIVMLFLGIGVLYELVPSSAHGRLTEFLSKAAVLFSSALIFFGCVYSNQVYLKKNVEAQQTLSLMTRVLYHMEQADGYTPGETKVALIGSLQDSKILFHKQGYDSITGRTLEFDTSIQYYNNYRMYLNNILGYPINLVEQDDATIIGRQPEVAAMPVFPHSGCAMMLDDILVVKLSDP